MREELREEITRRDEYWQNEISKIQKLSEMSNIRAQKLEAEKEKYLISRREIDTIRAKNMELEDKIQRQEQYMKNRLLKDRTNTLQMPEGSSKPVVGHGRTFSSSLLSSSSMSSFDQMPPRAGSGMGHMNTASSNINKPNITATETL